jgi:hypothetical protein
MDNHSESRRHAVDWKRITHGANKKTGTFARDVPVSYVRKARGKKRANSDLHKAQGIERLKPEFQYFL